MNLSMGQGGGFSCPNCRQPFTPQIEQIIDVGRDPASKARFLSGQSSTATCPNCGYRAGVATPMLYHDPEKELFLVYVPMELGLQQQEQERVIGQLVKAAMDATPTENRRGYMFQPRSMFSLQGMLEAVLEADGVTPEMLEAQRAKMRFVETLLQTDEDDLPALVEQHDDQIDVELFDIITLAAQNAVQSGREDMARHALAVRDSLLELSTAGKIVAAEAANQEEAVQEVIAALGELGESPSIDDFIGLLLGYAESDIHLQALVGLQYPVFDYGFFQELSGRIEQASDGEKARLQGLRDHLLELIDMIKEQQQAMVQGAVQVLQDILRGDDVEAGVMRNLSQIDDTFLMVLDANLKRAEENKDLMQSARLKQVYDVVMKLLQENVPPELRFVTELLQQDDLSAAQAMIVQDAPQFGDGLLQMMDALHAEMVSRGDEAMAGRLDQLRQFAAEVVS
jgi:hypothetical protein